MRYLFISIFLIIFLDVPGYDDLKMLKDLCEKANDHGKMIKTIRMMVTHKMEVREDPPVYVEYSLIYRKKDNHWLGEYKRHSQRQDEHTGEMVIKTEKAIHEQIDDASLIFRKHSNSGVIENNFFPGFGGIKIYGLSGIHQSWSSINLDPELIEIKEGIYNIKYIKAIQYKGNEAYEVVVENKMSRVRIVFIPSWQYSIAEMESGSFNPDKGTITKQVVKMKKEPSTGIWFPSYAQIQFVYKGVIKWTDTLEYKNVVLNQPVTDDQISFKIPKDAKLIHDIDKETYKLSKPATLEDILSGKVKSMQKESEIPVTLAATIKESWRSIKSSILFRFFLIMAISGTIFLTITKFTKRSEVNRNN